MFHGRSKDLGCFSTEGQFLNYHLTRYHLQNMMFFLNSFNWNQHDLYDLTWVLAVLYGFLLYWRCCDKMMMLMLSVLLQEVYVHILDLSETKKVWEFAEGFKKKYKTLNVLVSDLPSLSPYRQNKFNECRKWPLSNCFFPPIILKINNAGCMMTKREVNAEGFEKSFAINSLGEWSTTHMIGINIILYCKLWFTKCALKGTIYLLFLNVRLNLHM